MFFYIFLYFVSLVSIKWYLMALICIFSLSKAEHLLLCLWILCVWHYYSCFVLTNFSLMPKRKWLLFYSLQYNPLFSLVILMCELFLIQQVTSSWFFFFLSFSHLYYALNTFQKKLIKTKLHRMLFCVLLDYPVYFSLLNMLQWWIILIVFFYINKPCFAGLNTVFIQCWIHFAIILLGFLNSVHE